MAALSTEKENISSLTNVNCTLRENCAMTLEKKKTKTV